MILETKIYKTLVLKVKARDPMQRVLENFIILS